MPEPQDGGWADAWCVAIGSASAASGARVSEAERKAKPTSPLSDEEDARLEALGVMWDVLVEQWEKNYAALRAFYDREGHANVPKRHKTADGLGLGVWLQRQRTRYQARGMSEAERKAGGSHIKSRPFLLHILWQLPVQEDRDVCLSVLCTGSDAIRCVPLWGPGRPTRTRRRRS